MRPQVKRTATATRGVRKVTRTYGSGQVTEKYEVRVKDGTGSLVNEGTFDKYKDACQVVTQAKGRVQDGSHVRRSAGALRFLDVAEDWLGSARVAGMKQRTSASHRIIVHGRLKPLHKAQIKDLGYREVNRFAASLANDGLAPATQRRILWVLRAVLDEAVHQGYVAINPCTKLPAIKGGKAKIKPPEQEDVERLIVALPMPWSLLVELAAYSGLRAGELAGLRVRHLDLSNAAVIVEDTVVDVGGNLRADSPKSEAGHRVVTDLDPDLVSRLSAHVRDKRSADYVFGDRDPDGKPRPYRHGNFLARVFNPTRRALGLDSLRVHDLRHFYASLLIDEGLTAPEVAKRLGHADAAFTLRTYVHLFDKKSVRETGLASRIAARRAEAQGTKVIPLRSVG